MPRMDFPRIAVLGAGPIGLEAALYARSLDLPVVVYERGRIGEHLHRWGHVRLFTPFAMNATPLGRVAIRADHPRHEFPADSDHLTGRQHLEAYLAPLAGCSRLQECLRLDTTVLHIGRHGCLKDDPANDAKRDHSPFRLLLRQGKNREHVEQADVVLDCTGTYSQHRWMGDGGIPAIGELAAECFVAYGIDDVLGERKAHYAGKNILVVGAGYSAATTVTNLSTLAQTHLDTWIVWLARTSSTQPIRRHPNDPLKERDRLAQRANTLATRAEGNVEFHKQTFVEAIESVGQDKGFKVTAVCAGRSRTFEVDRLVANVGYTPDASIYRELQVRECPDTLAPRAGNEMGVRTAVGDGQAGRSGGPSSLKQLEPNFYVLGAKSFGRDSNFLLHVGFEQVRDVFTLILGKLNLDLYRSPR